MLNSAEEVFSDDWKAIAGLIENGNHFLITTHVNADPDALGSELALMAALRSVSKNAFVLNPSPVSKYYTFLDPNSDIRVYAEDQKLEQDRFDAVFILDISRWERLGPMADPIRNCDKPKICIDHHPYSGGFADYHLVNTHACASAEIVYDLLQYLNIPLSKRIAECIYASVVADTGSFSFSNTNARAHRIASDLFNYSICSRTIFEELYQNHTPARMRFLGKALSSLQFDCNQRLAWMSISHQMLKENGLCPEDVEGFADFPRNCRDVLLSILFLEVQPGDIKISLRAKHDFNANKLAALFGGGGHNHASGMRMTGALPLVQETVLAEARKALQQFVQ